MRYFIAISLFVCFSLSADAQFELRPFMGVNFSDVSKAPDGVTTQARLGAQVGASAIFGNKLHFMPGIAWFARSTEFSVAGATNFDQKINGVLIPLLVGYRFADAENRPFFNARLFAGPAMMFLTTTEFTNGQANENVDWSSTQWGAQMGVGFDIAIFFVDAGYEFGLSNTAEGIGPSGFSDFRNNTFFANAGVRLSF